MLDQIRAYAKAKGFHPQTLRRWLEWSEPDRAALFRLGLGLKLGENHLRDLMNWLEEIALRDETKIAEILARKTITEIEADPRLGRAEKVKRLKEQVRRLRFPRLASLEDSIRTNIQELKLQPEVELSVAPGLEGGLLHVEFNASNKNELQKKIAKLAEAAEKQALRKIFALLAGEDAETTE